MDITQKTDNPVSEAADVSTDVSPGLSPKAREFLILTFGISWTSALLAYLVGVQYGTMLSIAVIMISFMWAPGWTAIIVSVRHGERVRDLCLLRRGRLSWVVVAWLTPTVLVALTIFFGTLIPGVSLSTDFALYLADVGMTAEQVEIAMAQLQRVPVPPLLLFLAQGLLAGVTVNALAALGEELGWRGLLLNEMAPAGFWRGSFFIGAVWGVWHAPIILQGHNFPDNPWLGVVMMTVTTTAVAPVYTYLTLRARTVLAATVLHGAFNGLAALSLVYLSGGTQLLIGPMGVAGTAAALAATGLCVAHDRYVAKERCILPGPLKLQL